MLIIVFLSFSLGFLVGGGWAYLLASARLKAGLPPTDERILELEAKLALAERKLAEQISRDQEG